MGSTESLFHQWMMITWQRRQKQKTRTSCSTIRRVSGTSPRSSSRCRSKWMTQMACGYWWGPVALKSRGMVSWYNRCAIGRGRGHSKARRRRRREGPCRTIKGIQLPVDRCKLRGWVLSNLQITIRGSMELLNATQLILALSICHLAIVLRRIVGRQGHIVPKILGQPTTFVMGNS